MNRTEIENLMVGDVLQSTFDVVPFSGFKQLKPNPRYGIPRKVVKITHRGVSIQGEVFVQGETEHGENATITFTIGEGEVLYRKVNP